MGFNPCSMQHRRSPFPALAALAFTALAAGCTSSANLQSSNTDANDLWSHSYVVMGHGISYVND